MKRKISLFKKIKLFSEYKKKLSELKEEIETSFGARIDNAWRIYNVINIPIDSVGEPYNIKKSDIDKIAENFIKEYTIEISKYLNTRGLSELFDFYEVKKVDKYSYLVVLGFSLFKTNEYYDTIRWKVIPISIGTILALILLILLL